MLTMQTITYPLNRRIQMLLRMRRWTKFWDKTWGRSTSWNSIKSWINSLDATSTATTSQSWTSTSLRFRLCHVWSKVWLSTHCSCYHKSSWCLACLSCTQTARSGSWATRTTCWYSWPGSAYHCSYCWHMEPLSTLKESNTGTFTITTRKQFRFWARYLDKEFKPMKLKT